MAGRMAGLRALVTGGSRGIGRAIAEAFLDEGAAVTIAATHAAKLEAARVALSAKGTVTARVCDVSDRDACFALVEGARADLGGLEVLVNCAGIYIPNRFVDYEPEQFRRIFDVNVHGPVHLMQAAIPGMAAAGYGKIVNIASTAGKWASMNQSAYNASKHAVVGLTRCVALETARQGIRVNAVCPGMVETDMAGDMLPLHARIAGLPPEAVMENTLKRIAMGRYMRADEIAALAVYLAAPESDGMTGQSIVLDGGMVFV